MLGQAIIENQCKEEIQPKQSKHEDSDALEVSALISKKFPITREDQFEIFNQNLSENKDFQKLIVSIVNWY